MDDPPRDEGAGARGRASAAAAWSRASAERAREAADRARAWAERERGRSRVVALGFDLAERDRDRLGGLLAGALAYRMFLWLLPFSLFLVGALGAIASVDGEAPEDISDNVGLRGFLGDTLADGARQSGWWIAMLIGLFATVYAGMGTVRALRISHAAAWGMRPERGGNPLMASLWLLAVVAGTLVVSGLTGWLRHISFAGGLLATLAIVGLYFGVWMAVSRHLPNRAPSPRALVPGALVVALGLEGLHLFTVYYLAGRAERAASVYGTIGAALTLLLWLFIVARLMVGGAILNAELSITHDEAEEAV